MYVSVCGGTRASDRARMYSFVTLVYVVPIDAFGEAPLLAAPENPLLVSGGETDEKAHCRLNPLWASGRSGSWGSQSINF